MYQKFAQYYDVLYLSFKDYRSEALKLHEIIFLNLKSAGRNLLDVACGTGLHLEYLQKEFDVEGLDINPDMLAIARQRLPDVPFHLADMTGFHLSKTYDIITCLFSSIGYVCTLERLNQAVACMASHLVRGGLLVIEPWFTPDAWKPATVHAMLIDEPELKIARVNTSFQKGNISFFDMHHLVGTPQRTEYFVEHHELGLFTHTEMMQTFENCNLSVTHNTQGLSGRGLYIGNKNL